MELIKLEVLQKFLNFKEEEDCPVCCGSGDFNMNEWNEKETCPECYGTGVIKEDK